MKSHIGRRIDVLERAAGVGSRWDYSRPCHEIIQEVGQSLAEAVRQYGADRIDDRDRVIVERIVAPIYDENGSVIPQKPYVGGLTEKSLRELIAEERGN
jgi:hypothetical protein